MLESFLLDLPVKIRFGCGVMDEIQKASLPGKRIMIVTGGKTIRANGTYDRLRNMVLPKAELVLLYDNVKANPMLQDVMLGADIAKENGIDCVIGLGGGSSLDTAKGIAAMAVNRGSLWDYTASGSGAGKIFENKPLPLIAIPTTAGTGSEANKTAVITDSVRKEKIGIRTDFPYAAYVDPELTLSIPSQHTAEQGFDAFCHCFEAYLSVKASPISDVFSIAGMQAIYKWLPKAVENGSDIEARYHVAFGSMLGGIVLYLSSASAAHTMEHMLSGMDPTVTHGGGLAMIFDAFHAVEAAQVPQRYAEVSRALGLNDSEEDDSRCAGLLLETMHQWKSLIGLDRLKLINYAFSADKVEEMVRMTHWVGGGPLTRDRYRLTDEDLAAILIRSLGA